jgi:magnesium-transporting ATPase (P-type)
MTGESVELKKDTVIACKTRKAEINAEQPKLAHAANEKDKERRHLLPSPVMQSGTSVAGGEGKMVTLMVGDDSCIGLIIQKLEVKIETTPLQIKLE